MNDPRNESYTTYTQIDLVFMGIFKNACSQESMREMDENFNEEICIDTLSVMLGNQKLEEMPHYDTLNYYMERLLSGSLADLRKRMVVSLIRGRQFFRNRLLGKYWRVVLDGTQMYCFKERHCENCLSTTEDGKKKPIIVTRYWWQSLPWGKDGTESGYRIYRKRKRGHSETGLRNECCKATAGKIEKRISEASGMYSGDCLYATEPVMEV